jgi:hypothetical protein
MLNLCLILFIYIKSLIKINNVVFLIFDIFIKVNWEIHRVIIDSHLLKIKN